MRTNLKHEKDKHKASKEEHQEQYNATKPSQVSTTTLTNQANQTNRFINEKSKENTNKTRQATTSSKKPLKSTA
jgi:hypothetical protein